MSYRSLTVKFEQRLYALTLAVATKEKRTFGAQVNFWIERSLEQYAKEHPEFNENDYLPTTTNPPDSLSDDAGSGKE
jgi:hypothetical protein